MQVWITALRGFGYIWLTAAVFFILAGIWHTWTKGGFRAVQHLLSPSNIFNYVATVIVLAPGVVALVLVKKLNEEKRSAQP